MTTKLACKKCGIMILPQTFKKNNGMCMPCVRGTRDSIEMSKREFDKIKKAQPHPEPEFICLECGSKHFRSRMQVIPKINENDPWSKVHSRIECRDCGCIMPLDLAMRLNITIEEAQKVWREKFRQTKQSNIRNI